MASGVTRNNHYISQFILRGFASDGNREKIWRYDLTNGDCRNESIAGVGFLRKGWSQEIETFFGSQYETKAAEILNSIRDAIDYFEKHRKVDNALRISKNNVNQIIEFLAMQFVRSFASSKYTELSMNDFLERSLILQNIANSICDRVENLVPGFIQDKVSYGSHKALRSALLNPNWLNGFTEDIRKELRKKQFNVFWIPKSRGLITSDFPIAFPHQRYGAAHPDSEWWFPLTKNIIIAFGKIPSKGKIEYRYIPITPKELMNLNKDIACQATRYIFGHNKELVLKYGNMHKKFKKSFTFDFLNKTC